MGCVQYTAGDRRVGNGNGVRRYRAIDPSSLGLYHASEAPQNPPSLAGRTPPPAEEPTCRLGGPVGPGFLALAPAGSSHAAPG